MEVSVFMQVFRSVAIFLLFLVASHGPGYVYHGLMWCLAQQVVVYLKLK